MNAKLLCAMIVLLAGPTAFGQTTQPNAHDRPPTPQEVRDRMRASRTEPSMSSGMVDRIKTELKLDASQISQIDQLVAENEKLMVALRDQMKMPPESIEAMTRLREELNKAQEANDQAKLKETGDKMQQMRTEFTERTKPVRERMTNMQNQFRDKMRGVLREDQREGFDRIWLDRNSGDMRSRMRQNPRMLKAMVDRVPELTSEQKTQIDDLFKQHNEAEKGLKDRAAREQASQRIYDAVMTILTPAQRAELDSRMSGRRDAKKPDAAPKSEEAKPVEPAAPKP